MLHGVMKKIKVACFLLRYSVKKVFLHRRMWKWLLFSSS